MLEGNDSPLHGCVLPEETAKPHRTDGYQEPLSDLWFVNCSALTAHDVMPFFRFSHRKPICDVPVVTQDQPHLSRLPLTPVSGIYCTCLILEPQDLTQCPLTF